MFKISRSPLPLLLLSWLLLNLLQAAVTPLEPDEAYYWQYASRLDWGYFDHPPLVALLISLGRDWLPGGLGLRLGHVLAGTLVVAGLWHLAGKPRGRSLQLFALLLFAQPMLQVYGFIATPDMPLILGTVLFLLAYRRWLHQPGATGVLLLGAGMALMLYAKYHGVLVIGFTVLSRPRLLLRPGFWLAGLFGALLFLPHLYWQYLHDYPSFRYHLAGRNDPYELRFTLSYLLNQVLIFNPLLLYFYLFTFLRRRPRGRMERTWFVLLYGFWGFFLLNTLKGPAEPHWTALLVVPLTLVVLRELKARPNWVRPFLRLGYISAALFIGLRLWLMLPVDYLPRGLQRTFANREWSEALARQAGDLPVVFENSYRNPSLYTFYTGRPAWSYTNTFYRPNQYDLWQADTALHNRPVLLAGHTNWQCEDCDTLRAGTKTFLTLAVDSFQVAKQMRFRFLQPPPRQWARGEAHTLFLQWENPYPYPIRPDAGNLPLRLYAVTRHGHEPWVFWPVDWQGQPQVFPARSSGAFQVRLPLSTRLRAGEEAELRFGWAYRGMPPIREQGEVVTFRVE